MWWFHQKRGTSLGIPTTRIVVFSGLYWGPPYLGKLSLKSEAQLLIHQRAQGMPPASQLRAQVSG